MTNDMISAYLERIGCPDARTVSRENLFRIQKAHLATVPYSNLTIFATGREPSLNTDDLFDRIVTKRWGGYCFELNGLLAELLRSLGYGVTEYFARWHFGEANPVPMRRHRILKVYCGGEAFIVDAGVGCLCPTAPLAFRLDEVQKRNERNYRLERDPQLGIMIRTETQDGFVPYFSFTEDPHFPQDFNWVNICCGRMPDSYFRLNFFAHLLTDERQIMLENPTPDDPKRYLKIRHIAENRVERTPIMDTAHLQQILAERFGIICEPDCLDGLLK